MFRGSKIFVAGHAGLLGGAIVRRLKENGYSRLVTRTRDELDLMRQGAVDAFFAAERPRVVFLAAGLTGGISANIARPADFLHVNLIIQDNLFEAAKRHGVEDLVFFGSSCVYPKGLARPIAEDDLLAGPIEETSAPYAIAKIAGIKACKAYNEQYLSTRFIAMVPNSIYGPGDSFDPVSSHVLAALIARIADARERGFPCLTLWGTGTPRREFIYCDDAADAAIFALEHAGEMENEHYNVGTGTDYSIRELAEMISSEIGYEGEIAWDASKPDGTARKLLESARFASLGWSAKVGLQDGIRRTCEWYLKMKKGVRCG